MFTSEKVYWLQDRYCHGCNTMKKNIDFHADTKKTKCKECINSVRRQGRAKLHGSISQGESWKNGRTFSISPKKG